MPSRAVRLLLPLLLLTACTTQARDPVPRDRNLVTSEELLATHVGNLYQAIEQLRPNFLHDRGFASLQSNRAQIPMVYVDNVLMGDTDYLRTINPMDVAEVRRLSAEEATTRYGTGHVGGAILVVTHSLKPREQGG